MRKNIKKSGGRGGGGRRYTGAVNQSHLLCGGCEEGEDRGRWNLIPFFLNVFFFATSLLSHHPSFFTTCPVSFPLIFHLPLFQEPEVMLAQSEATKKEKEENIFKHAWHSVEEALHLRSDPPVEDVPPPGNALFFTFFTS